MIKAPKSLIDGVLITESSTNPLQSEADNVLTQRSKKHKDSELHSLKKEEEYQLRMFVRRAKKLGTNEALDGLLFDEDICWSSKKNRKASRNEQELIDTHQIKTLEEFKSEESFNLNNSPFWNEIPEFDGNENNLEKASEDDESIDLEEESEVQKTRKLEGNSRFVIPLESNFKFIWDHLQILLMLYVAILVPYRICYLGDYIYPVWDIIDNFIDFLFFLDVIFNFFTPIFDKEVQVKNHCRIIFSYMKLWFWIDVLSVFPFELLFSNLAMNNYSILLKISKMPRLYKFMKGAKMLRTIKMQNKGKKTLISKVISFFYESDNIIMSIIPIYLLGILMAHLFACGWFFLSNNGNPEAWVFKFDYHNEAPFDQYIASLYYIYTTFTTCGYGDIVPGTQDEYFATIIFVFIGVTFLSFVYTTMIQKLQDYNSRFQEFNEKKLELSKLSINGKLFKNQFPSLFREMMMIIDEHLEHDLKQIKLPQFLELKPKLHNRLLIEICNRQYHFNKLSFFSYIPQYTWHFILEKLEERIYSKGDIIYETGNPSTHLFIIKMGKVWVMMKKSEFSRYPFIEVDSFFGEYEVFTGKKRNWTVVAKKNTQLYSIEKSIVMKLFQEDRFREPFIKMAKRRFREFSKAEKECKRLLKKKNNYARKIKKRREKAALKIRDSIWERKQESGRKWHSNITALLKSLDKNASPLFMKRRGGIKGEIDLGELNKNINAAERSEKQISPPKKEINLLSLRNI